MSTRSETWNDIETLLDLVRVEEEALLAVSEALAEFDDPEAEEFSWDEFPLGRAPVGRPPGGRAPMGRLRNECHPSLTFPPERRPRERLNALGPEALTGRELMALLVGSGGSRGFCSQDRGRRARERGGVVADFGSGLAVGDRGDPRSGYGHRRPDCGGSRARSAGERGNPPSRGACARPTGRVRSHGNRASATSHRKNSTLSFLRHVTA